MAFRILEVPGSEPGPLLHALVEAGRLLTLALYGCEDLHQDLPATQVDLTPTQYSRSRAWVALPAEMGAADCAPGDVLASAKADFPLAEDTSTVFCNVGVRPEARGRGIGTALFDTVMTAREGRTVLQGWTPSPAADPGDPDALASASGTGAVDGRDPTVRWLRTRGFDLEIVERYSCLDLARPGLDGDLDTHLANAAAAAGSDYDLVAWHGAVPEDLRDDVADLNRRFSLDVPTAGLESDEMSWDADRVALSDARQAERGRERASMAVRHVPSGRLVALSVLEWPRRDPAAVGQGVTLVEPDHRRHRLGLWVKAANLRHLVAVNPEAKRVHTWNALENGHMLAINDLLGFEPLGLEGAWQRRLGC